jgi:hypothetical protein
MDNIKSPNGRAFGAAGDDPNKKAWAQHLFTKDHRSEKDIASITGISEAQIRAWIVEENWTTMSKLLLTTKSQQLLRLHEILQRYIGEANDSLDKNGSQKSTDPANIIKITTAIKNLEDETGIGDMVETLKAFIAYTINHDFPAGQFINKWADKFVQYKLSFFQM